MNFLVFILAISGIATGLLLGLAGMIYDYQLKKNRLTGNTSKRDVDELRDEVASLRNELRDVHEMLADLTLMVGESDLKSLPEEQ